MPARKRPPWPAKKRLILACDGTWMNLDRAWRGLSWLPSWIASGESDSLETVPSNVTRICRTISHEGEDGIPQIVYYSAGVGSDDSLYAHLFGGITGRGVDEHIREAYSFIQSNWNDGDEIVLLGFSRGAFTARSIAAFLSAAGVLTRSGMNQFQNIFQDWECQLYDDYRERWPDDLEPSARPRFGDGSYQAELVKRGMTHLNVPIKAIAVWDTVGSLGIPDIGPFNFRKRLSFVDTQVSSAVEYAFQALALDEERRPFLPTLWELPRAHNQLKSLQQCWFPGVHGNIGSGYDDTEISDLTLSWMISKLQMFDILQFLPEAVIEQRELGVKRMENGLPRAAKRWGLGKLYDSMTAFFWIGGRAMRNPGRCRRSDPKTGHVTGERLSGTNESIHPSVRIRMALGGKGIGGDGVYRPKPLRGWEVVSKSGEGYVWRSDLRDDIVELPEEKMEGLELELLECSPEIYKMYTEGFEVDF